MEKQGRFKELMRQVNEGSEDAVRELVQVYGPHILRVVRLRLSKQLRSRFDSADFVQSVWASFFALSAGRVRFDKAETLVAYLAQMARHKVIDAVRRRLGTQRDDVNREQPIDSKVPLQARPGFRVPTASELAIAREEWERLHERLPEEFHPVLDGRLRGESLREIADQLGVHPRTVRRKLDRLSPDADPPAE